MALAVTLGVVASPLAAEPVATCELGRSDRAGTPSTRCLACHDGTTGPALGPSHPVEVDYARASTRDPRRYVPAAALSRQIKLVNGNVACVTCHDGASPHRSRTVDPATLCQACHRM